MAKLYEFIPEGTKVRHLTEEEAAGKYGRYGEAEDGDIIRFDDFGYDENYANITGAATRSDNSNDTIVITYIDEDGDKCETYWVPMAYVEKIIDEQPAAE